MSFGHLPLFTESIHTCSLITNTDVQLLMITAKDFHDIFNRQHRRTEYTTPNNNDTLSIAKCNIDFIRQLHLFTKWPVDKILDQPSVLKTHVYKRSQVITKDANRSKYVYIIKTGRASVWTHFNNNTMDKYREWKSDVKNFDRHFAANEPLEKHHSVFIKEHASFVYSTMKEIDRLRVFEARVKLKQKLDFIEDFKKNSDAGNCYAELCHEYFPSGLKKSVKWAPVSTVYYYTHYANELQDEPKETVHLPYLNIQKIRSDSEKPILRRIEANVNSQGQYQGIFLSKLLRFYSFY